VDWVRLIVLVEALAVLGMSVITIVQTSRYIIRHRHRRPSRQIQIFAWGRMAGPVGHVFLCFGFVEGMIELWSEPRTVRLLWVAVGLLFVMLYWMSVVRLVRPGEGEWDK
jgi:UDP-N-acetylmuramyl pentapeptide phosphotransferase/UDP-N-acetylglucosamine-1-phosphate transferase